MVGASCRITIRTMVSMPLRPRSSTRVSPPVLRSRWKRSDSRCMCSKVMERQPAHRMHGDGGEQAVAPLLQERHQHAHAAIGEGQQDRARRSASRARHRSAVPPWPVRRIGRPFEGERHRDGGELGQHQEHHGTEHAQLQVARGRTARYRATDGAGCAAASRPRRTPRACRNGWLGYGYRSFARRQRRPPERQTVLESLSSGKLI